VKLGTLLSTAALFALVVSCSCSNGSRPTNVLLITLDTTRADALGCYGGPTGVSPNIDRLAQHGVLFEQAYTPVPVTLPAHSSLFTGRYPHEHGVRNNNVYSLPEREITLAEVLAESGFDTAAFIGAYVLAEPYGLTQGFDHYDATFEDDTKTSTFAQRSAGEVTDATLAWLGSRETDKPFFAWVHYYDPHYPYVLPPGAQRQMQNLYHEEVRFCDSQLQRILDRLRDRGELDDTLIVITSDHGEGLGEHGESTHGYFLYQGTQHIPLIFSHPDLEQAERKADAVSLLDVVPTVLNFLGLDSPSVSGSEILHANQLDRSILLETELTRADFSLTPVRGLVNGTHKLIALPESELYDLVADPRETSNLASRDQELLQELHAALDRIDWQSASDARHRPDAESTKRIQGLGYAGGEESTTPEYSDWDPSELAQWISLRNAGLEHFFADRKQEAIGSMRALLVLCPDSHPGHLYLGLALAERGDFLIGLEHLQRAVELQPDASADAYWNMTVCLHELGKDDMIPPMLQRAIELNPEHRAARQKLAELSLRAKNIPAARVHLRVLRDTAPESREGLWAIRILSSMKREP
jgi:choline-sulfatase